jgi:hypothetical protein
MFLKKLTFIAVLLACTAPIFAATVSGNVKDTLTNKAVAGATVTLRQGFATIATTTSDSVGAFSFLNVVNGTYTIRAVATGFTTKTSPNVVVAGNVDPAPTALLLAPIPVINLTGTVTDSAAGTPVLGAALAFRLFGPGGVTRRDTTPANGTYAFDTVAAGNYALTVTAAGFATQIIPVTMGATSMVVNVRLVKIILATVTGTVTDSVTGALMSGIVVTLRSGIGAARLDTTGGNGVYSFDSVANGNYTVSATVVGYVAKTLNVTAAGAPTITVNLPLVPIVNATVTGTITDSVAGTPVTGVAVAFRATNGGATRRDTTAANGVYSFDSVTNGTYTVTATAAGYISQTINVTAAGALTITANIRLVKIVYATVTGTVTDSGTGALMSGIVVTLRAGIGAPRTATTIGTGVYTFDSVTTGAFSVSAAAAGYLTKTVNDTVKVTGTKTINLPLVQIQFSTLTGTVSDSATGALMSGIVVTLRPAAGAPRTATSAGNGVYTFDSVATGTYTLSAAAAGFVTKTLTVTTRGTATQTVNLPLVPIQYPTLTGTITDSGTGALINGVAVALRPTGVGGLTRRDTTAGNGVYSFDSVATGTYTLTVTATGYVTQVINVTSSGSGTLTVNVKLVSNVAVEIAPSALAPLFALSNAGVLCMRNFVSPGTVKVFGINGKLICSRSFAARTASMDLSGSLKQAGVYVVRISQGASTYSRHQVVMP